MIGKVIFIELFDYKSLITTIESKFKKKCVINKYLY